MDSANKGPKLGCNDMESDLDREDMGKHGVDISIRRERWLLLTVAAWQGAKAEQTLIYNHPQE